jgi:hypothetical protein
MRTRIAVIFTAALTLTGVLLSCNGTGAIYSTIEAEKKTPVSTLNQNITVLDLVNTGATGLGALPYFVAAGAIYNGTPVDATTGAIGWPNLGQSPVAIPGPSASATCHALVLAPNFPTDNSLYGGFFTDDGSIMGLYKSVPNGSTYTFQGGTQVTGGGTVSLTGKQIILLQVVNSLLFVVAGTANATNYTYELDYYDPAGPSWTQVPGMTGLTAPVTGVAHSSLGGSTYFVTVQASSTTATHLFAGPLAALVDVTASLNTATNPNPNPTTDDLKGVTVDSLNDSYVMIPARLGTVYYSTDKGSTWNHVTTGDQVSNGNTGVIGFLTVSQEVGSTGPVYLVGSDGNGFYFLTMSLTPANVSLVRFSDVTQTGLYQGAVRRIMVDAANNNLVFLGNASTGPGYYAGVSEGLWRNYFDPVTGQVKSGSTWVHE